MENPHSEVTSDSGMESGTLQFAQMAFLAIFGLSRAIPFQRYVGPDNSGPLQRNSGRAPMTRPDSSQDCPAFLSHEDNMHLHHDAKLNTALALLRLGGECFGQHGQVTDHAPTFDRQ